MDKLAKLLKRISKKERQVIKHLIYLLLHQEFLGLHIVKLKGTSQYRLKKGRFRIIFSYNKNGKTIIENVRIRNEKTYKDL